MKARWIATALGLVVAGCGGSSGSEGTDSGAPDAQVLFCGSEVATLLLPLGPDDDVSVTAWQAGLLYDVTRYDEHGAIVREVWATGPCGENGVMVAQDLNRTQVLRSGTVVGCQGPEIGDGIYRIDPTGAEPAAELFASAVCQQLLDTDWGLVTAGPIQMGLGPLVIHPDPSQPAISPVTLVDSVYATWMEVEPDGRTLLVIDQSFRILRVDLETHQWQPYIADAVRFELSSDARYLAWQATPDLGSQGAIYMRTLASDQDQYLAHAYTPLSPPYETFHWTEGGAFFYVVDDMYFYSYAHELATGTEVDLPTESVSHEMGLGDGTVLGIGWPGGDNFTFVRWDLSTGSEVVMFGGQSFPLPRIGHVHDAGDGIELIHLATNMDTEGPLLFSPYSGASSLQVAEAVGTAYLHLDRNRIVTVLNRVRGVGDLYLLVLEGGGQTQMDQSAIWYSVQVFEGFGTYQVSDSGNGRSGVWGFGY